MSRRMRMGWDMCHAWEVQNIGKVKGRTCREETIVRSGHRGEDNFKIYLGLFYIAAKQGGMERGRTYSDGPTRKS
jgi:hypothetical protein